MEADPFDQPVRGDGEEDADFLLRLDSYEGPIDVLLDQARSQRVDLAQVSILALAEQYLAFVERARRLRLDLAAEYLVMAAWLALLKSRLLLPDERTSEEPSAAEMAEALALQLRRLEAVRRSLGRHCPNCAYDLRQIATDRCPECGSVVPPAASVAVVGS